MESLDLSKLVNKKVLFFSPHMDDDAISAGALLYSLAKKNTIISVYVTNSAKGVSKDLSFEKKVKLRQVEGLKSCKLLGVKALFLNMDNPVLEVTKSNINLISDLLSKECPDIVFIPVSYDAHPTHAKVHDLVLEAARDVHIGEFWFYEVWTPITNPNFLYFFDKNIMKIKVRAIKQHKSQLERTDFVKAVLGLDTFRCVLGEELVSGFGGVSKIHGEYAEAFLISKKL
ncbi:Diacetylchitobiose deacetylase [Candidatus Tiddalikarchaeum anstoanum]|nr:Diacetylchitobiose deacetylase [Candidatus Tiddalikarchaeum anstoanum]